MVHGLFVSVIAEEGEILIVMVVDVEEVYTCVEDVD